MLLRPALPLEVDGQEVGTARDEEPDDLSPVLRVAHEVRDLGENPAGGARIAHGSPLPEKGVRLVDHHRHGGHGLEDT